MVNHAAICFCPNQSNEVGGGDNMEKEGLKRSLHLLEACGVSLDSVVTDCDSQVQEFLSEANVTHYCDVRHMEKSIVSPHIAYLQYHSVNMYMYINIYIQLFPSYFKCTVIVIRTVQRTGESFSGW